MKNKLIAVDDNLAIVELIRDALEKQSIEVKATTSSKKALELFLEDPTLVIVSDLSMPEMRGDEFMRKVFELGFSPIFIILTFENDPNKVAELFRQGAHDYIMKPFNAVELANRVNRAFEVAELRLITANIKKEREIRIEHQLNWNLFKENLIKKNTDKTDSGLIANINTNFIQGAGLGLLAAVAQMIKEDYKLENDRYSIKKDLVDTLLENIDISSKLISLLGDIEYIMNNDLPKEKLLLNEVSDLIYTVILENSKYEKIKNHQVKLSESRFNSSTAKIVINIEYFKKAIQELLLNAFKFSEPNSKIYVLFELFHNIFQISILNSPQKDSKQSKGILPEYQSIIFEPFFRLSRYVDESYNTLDYGLGLCYVEKIVRQHNGKISIANLKNSLEGDQSIFIDVIMELPFSN